MLYYKYSRLFSAVAGSNGYTPDPLWNPANTSQADWDDAYKEYGVHSDVSFTTGPAGSGSDTGVLPTVTLPFNPNYPYLLKASNGNWTSDVCSFTLEFLDAAGNVVAMISTPGTGNYQHELRYGATVSSYTVDGGSGYMLTHGTLTFTSTAMVYTRDQTGGYSSSNYHNDFSFSCAGLTITQVRISNVRARSTYSGNGSAYCMLYRNLGQRVLINAQGTVKLNGIPVSRKIYAYDRATGAKVGETLSAADGTFSVDTGASLQVYVVAMPLATDNANALIFDYIGG